MDGVMEDLEEHFEDGRWHCPTCDNTATPETVYAGKAQFYDRKGLLPGQSEKYATFKLAVITAIPSFRCPITDSRADAQLSMSIRRADRRRRAAN